MVAALVARQPPPLGRCGLPAPPLPPPQALPNGSIAQGSRRLHMRKVRASTAFAAVHKPSSASGMGSGNGLAAALRAVVPLLRVGALPRRVGVGLGSTSSCDSGRRERVLLPLLPAWPLLRSTADDGVAETSTCSLVLVTLGEQPRLRLRVPTMAEASPASKRAGRRQPRRACETKCETCALVGAPLVTKPARKFDQPGVAQQ